MGVPTITSLQYFILCQLADADLAGHELRSKLQKEGIRKSGPAFYQLMARLEDARMVTGWYENATIDGQIVRERRYEITCGGRSAAFDYAAYAARHLPYALAGDSN